MKWMITVAALALLSVATRAEELGLNDLEEEAGDARLGFVTVNADGTTSLTFNATSIQNAVLLGLFILVLGALLVPFLSTGYGYGGGYHTGTGHGTGHGTGYEHGSTGYHGHKRSAEFMGPVLEALSSAYKKYDDDEEEE